MATRIRPIVFKVTETEPFIMNASNATTSGSAECWESPAYPSEYNGNGKTAIVTISAPLVNPTNLPLFYGSSASYGGPTALTIPANPDVGTYTFILDDNPGIAAGYGKYFVLGFSTSEAMAADASKIEIRIINP